jgi:SAM-dependent methyltransferase
VTAGTFGHLHAGAYDSIYATKDYEHECDVLVSLFETYGDVTPIRRVLDVGCGTGGHALGLERRGYTVVGFDRSQEMLDIAREKARAASAAARFFQADARIPATFPPVYAGEFDAAILMFTVLGYLTVDAELKAALQFLHSHLRPGALLVADHWYGPAVLSAGPSTRFRAIEEGSTTYLRCAGGTLDVLSQIYTIDLDLWRIDDARPVERVHEVHFLRFFFPRELHLLFESSGFQLLAMCAFPDVAREPTPSEWWSCVVARRKG